MPCPSLSSSMKKRSMSSTSGHTSSLCVICHINNQLPLKLLLKHIIFPYPLLGIVSAEPTERSTHTTKMSKVTHHRYAVLICARPLGSPKTIQRSIPATSPQGPTPPNLPPAYPPNNPRTHINADISIMAAINGGTVQWASTNAIFPAGTSRYIVVNSNKTTPQNQE